MKVRDNNRKRAGKKKKREILGQKKMREMRDV